MNLAGNAKKRPPPGQPSPAAKVQARGPEDEFVDEDVFLEETLIAEDEMNSNREWALESLASNLAKWKRPSLSPDYVSQSTSITFQQLELDYVVSESHEELLGDSSGHAPIIRIFGVTAEGHSVCCKVHGFEPYFYISCPPGMGPDDISQFHQTLEWRMRELNRDSKVSKIIKRIELVHKKSIMYYQQQESNPFLKIVLALPTMVPSCRGNTTSRYSALVSHAPEGEFSKMAPFRILSFDIECAGRKGHFPEPTHDPVIQVANLVTLQGESQPFVRNVMTLKSCSPIVGADVMSFETEREVLLAWRRAQSLGILEFAVLGRIRNTRVTVKDTTFSSRQYGTRQSKEIALKGRVQFDLLQDAYLPQRLLDKLMYIYNYVEMARVTGVPISFLLSRGQSIKVLSQLLRKSKEKGLVLPYVKLAGSDQGTTYEGATVLDAKKGFYEKPIATLDFASLYPSIMMAYNLCYCTLVTPEDVKKLNLPPECVNKTPLGETFVKPSLQKGILPEILEELIAARKRAKADLKEAKDPFEKAVLDGRQLALKISANSVYGFTGATIGQLPCLEISSSVTSYGRQMIEHTRKLVEDKFTMRGGYEFNAEVIYGDTDSVMVQFGVPTVEETMRLGTEAAEYITETFIKPIKLEFEKVYFPYLLISKKKYAGLYWTTPAKYDKMDTKGIETVRRDNCLMVKNLVTECLHKILMDRDVPGAVQYVKNIISDLLMNRLDLSLLVITKGLTKTGDDYEVKAAHVELAERMRKRDAATAPNVGDRVSYVMIESAKGAKPLLRIFEPILKNAKDELLSGAHTRNISKPIPSSGGIMRFAKKQLTCLGCKALIKYTVFGYFTFFMAWISYMVSGVFK
ncbi:unnamed protein product [Linum tenue]|uniref:DNA polymerase n=1 Tax=Linum tenue TaxID=586396 RepID=A0AAV0JZG7_9ROSI|nr:unnamed protein product [Linum tenue]